jgi:hypothetical protein
MTYKTDTNHATIRDGLRDIYGKQAIKDVSMYRGLGFDLLAYVRGRVMLLEVKQPRKVTRLTDSEQEARDAFGDSWRVVCTLEEALEAVGA